MTPLLPLDFCRSLLAGDAPLANTSNRLQAGSCTRSVTALLILLSGLVLLSACQSPKPLSRSAN